ncbi:hybrid sensor histidine kinase/response regulator [Thalassotalea piscium]
MKIFTNEIYSDDELLLIESEHRKAYLKLFKSTLFVQALFPLILCYVFYSLISNQLLFGWLSAILLITLIRGYVTFGWYKPEFSTDNVQRFETISLFLSLLAGCLWGVTVLIMDFNQYPEASVFLNIIVFGLTAGSVGIGSYWLGYFLVYNISVISIYILVYMAGLPQPYYLLAISLSLFLMFMVQIALVFHRGNAQNIWLIKRNEKLAENLELKKEEAENFASSRTRFLASASHDLRQPLQALNFFLSALDVELTSEKSRSLFLKLEKCAEGMNELLNAILDLSKLDAQIVTLNQEACCMNSLLDKLKQQFQMQADRKGIQLLFQPCSQYVYSDNILLQRILSNLISNAVNYTQTGKVEILISHNDTLLIEVRDTGPGLTAKEQEQIFEEFYQLNNPERDKKKGLGLGLSIVERLCQLMHIPINLTSEKGKGSCFSLNLPTCGAPVKQKELVQLAPQTLIKNKKILIIDDEISIRESLTELLLQWQCQVMSAESADEACEMLEQNHYVPELIIADYRLRENKTGVDAINRVKGLLKKEEIPAIIISGDTEPARLREVTSSGYEFLHKPVKPAHLRMLMQQKLM